MHPRLWRRDEDGTTRPGLVIDLPPDTLAISLAPYGGRIGPSAWVITAKVSKHYDRDDPFTHLDELRRDLGLGPDGVGLLTAAEVEAFTTGFDDGAEVIATVGLTFPIWAATIGPRGSVAIPDGDDPTNPVRMVASPGERAPRVGTIIIVCWVPERLAPGALVNTVATVTDAKTQALGDAGVPGTGTATDAVAIVCPAVGPVATHGGPRSHWGGRLARAVHAAVHDGAVAW